MQQWDALLDEARSDALAQARVRERWLRRQASESATLLGTLIDLAEAGVNLSKATTADHGLVALAKLDGIVAEIDQPDQRLLIKARADCLAPQRIDLLRASASTEPSSTTGFVASYNLTAETGDLSHSAQTSGVNGTISVTGFAQTLDGSSRAVRLDTTAEWDEPGLLRRLLLGDAITGGLASSRSVRFGGIELATDFTLEPGLITFPLPEFFGQTAVPGSVDVFVNSAKVFEGDVSPGPFELNNLPTVTGGGEATVVVRNILGQEMSETFSFYASDALLQEGRSAYDLDLGFLRQRYGERSFDYAEPIAAGTYRYGVSNWLTRGRPMFSW